jgi:hypothetical protein
VHDPDLAGWWSNFTRWYGHFLVVPSAYTALAAFIEIVFGSHSPAGAALSSQGSAARLTVGGARHVQR